jgi:hypothetical protein
MLMVALAILLMMISGDSRAQDAAAEQPALEADLARVMKASVAARADTSKYGEFARHFVAYGRRWKVDPLLIACVARIESGYKATPHARWSTSCTTSRGACVKGISPCLPIYQTLCKRVRITAGEAGMMQVLWYDRSTRAGYKLCTGQKLLVRGSRAQRVREARAKLNVPKVAICVGAYELGKWRSWAMKGGHGLIRCKRYWQKPKGEIKCPLRMRPRTKWNVQFFRRNRDLRPHFWVSFYNWGSNKWVGNAYPRAVLTCYKRYSAAIRKLAANRVKPFQLTDRQTSAAR